VLTIRDGNEVHGVMRLELNARRQPAWLTIYQKGAPPLNGIYRIEGDTVVVRWMSLLGGARPIGFTGKRASGETQFVLRRLKPSVHP
jgi:uncharacterized protein (TIGR03067 family)